MSAAHAINRGELPEAGSTPAGDLYVALKIVLSPAISEHAKALYETMRQGFNFDARAHVYR